jgi:hypothetical protein
MAIILNYVAELQGLYGPFTMAERVVQKIWLREDFARDRATLTDGRAVQIRSVGAWNLLGGPDFYGARVVIAGQEITGDIEVHFHQADWRAHQHAADPAYARVVLHVVLFPPSEGELPAQHADGRVLPTLVLLPLLHRDLEEYASDDALEIITARDQWERFAALAAEPIDQRRAIMRAHAQRRWQQKVHFAQRRIAQLGWMEAAHQTALEILGYQKNRAAFLAVATHYPLARWGAGIEPAEIFASSDVSWRRQGIRPANHPLTRLRQYQRWVTHQPEWPERLGRLLRNRVTLGEGVSPSRARQLLGLKLQRTQLVRELLGGAVGGSRLDNLVCDGFLPLLAAREGGDDLFNLWFYWYLGDFPDVLRRALPKLGLTGPRGQSLCHGCAQGLLGWVLQHEACASH